MPEADQQASGEMESITIDKVRLEIDKRLVSPTIAQALRKGYYEAAETKIYAALVTRDDVVVEIGGGIGYQSSFLWWARQPKKMVLFEANPKLIPLIERNHALNHLDAEVRNEIVVGKRSSARVPFYIRPDFWASSLSPSPEDWTETVEVATTEFQSVIDLYRPTVLLVDIEGGEVDLFDTIPLDGIQKICVELHPSVIGPRGLHRVFERLVSSGFYPDVWRSQGGVIAFLRL